MAEQLPKLTPEVVDLAWQAALEASRTFDSLRMAEIDILQSQRNLDVVKSWISEVDEPIPAARLKEYGETAMRFLDKRRNDAQANFDLLTDMAAPMMLLPNSPFKPRS